MIRDIITIDEEKCNGCGLCISACHEDALALRDGKARLISDSYCDGLGACLPECPTGAISIQQREAAEFSLPEGHPAAANASPSQPVSTPCGCPGSQARTLKGSLSVATRNDTRTGTSAQSASEPAVAAAESELMQWPCQIKLVPVHAPYFENARLLISADCAAYARASFHQEFMKGRITLIGCPKLDAGSYVEKLTEILRANSIKSIMVTRMEVPCCGGLESAVKQALVNSGKMIPWQIVTLGTDGRIILD